MKTNSVFFLFAVIFALCGQLLAGFSVEALQRAGMVEFFPANEEASHYGKILMAVLVLQFFLLASALGRTNATLPRLIVGTISFLFAIYQAFITAAGFDCAYYGGCL